ncbi:hypothetical protein SAMN05421757_1061, partial [Tropicimonas sediminicola]
MDCLFNPPILRRSSGPPAHWAHLLQGADGKQPERAFSTENTPGGSGIRQGSEDVGARGVYYSRYRHRFSFQLQQNKGYRIADSPV